MALWGTDGHMRVALLRQQASPAMSQMTQPWAEAPWLGALVGRRAGRRSASARVVAAQSGATLQRRSQAENLHNRGRSCAWPSQSGLLRKRSSPSHAFLGRIANRCAGPRAVQRRGSPEMGPSWSAGKRLRARSTTIRYGPHGLSDPVKWLVARRRGRRSRTGASSQGTRRGRCAQRPVRRGEWRLHGSRPAHAVVRHGLVG